MNNITATINSYMKEAQERITDERGGAKYDYANFCTYSDFNWLRDEIKSDLDYMVENLEGELEEDEDIDEVLEAFSQEQGYSHFQDFISEYKSELMSEVDSLESEVDSSSISDLVYRHLTNEVKNRFMKIESATENLERLLVEKSVISAEDLKDLNGYKNAVAELSTPEDKIAELKKAEKKLKKKLKKIQSKIEKLAA